MDRILPKRASALLQRYLSSDLVEPADDELVSRLSAHFFDIVSLFSSLYGARTDWDVQFSRLIELLIAKWSNRPARLRAMDSARVEKGDWYNDGTLVAMQLYVERFSGTIAGLIDDLDYFADLGITALHLMPILETPRDENDGGYAVSDFLSVRNELGSLHDLARLAEKLHERGMVLILDYVLNHSSDEHEWAQRARAGEEKYRDYYYFFSDRTVPDLYEQTVSEIFPETAPGNFTYVKDNKSWVMTTFHNYQWDLNYTNPAVFLEMLGTLLDLANLGVDVFRFDAVAYLWKRIGTSCQNLPEAHRLVALFNSCVRVAAPGAVFVAEAIVQPREIARYFGTPREPECELAYNASLMVLLWDAIATGKAHLLQRGLVDLPRPPADSAWLNYLRCHDDIGLGYDEAHLHNLGWDPSTHRAFIVNYYTGEFPGSTARGQRFMYNPKNGDARISGTTASLAGVEWAIDRSDTTELRKAIDRVILLHAIVLSIGGVPVIYAGDELGITNDYSFREDAVLRFDNRWMHRPHIDATTRKRRTQPDTLEHTVFSRIRALIALRKETPALHAASGVDIVPYKSPHILSFVKRDGIGSRVLFVANVDRERHRVDVDLLRAAGFSSQLIDLVRGQALVIEHDAWTVEPYEFLLLQE